MPDYEYNMLVIGSGPAGQRAATRPRSWTTGWRSLNGHRMTRPDQPLDFFDATGAPVRRMPDAVRPGTNAVIFNGAGEVLLELRADNGL
mgnify:CR=1 FL=1